MPFKSSIRPINRQSSLIRWVSSSAAQIKPSTKKFPPKAQPLALATATVDGVQVASVDDASSPISTVSVVVGAGPRFQRGLSQLGAAQFLKSYGFKVGLLAN